MKLRAYQVLLFVLVMTSCSKDEDEITKKDFFYPLSIGNEWTYDLYTNKDGADSDEHIFSVVKDTSIIVQSETCDAFVVESYRASNHDDKWNVFWGHDSEGNLIQLGARVQSSSIIDKSIQYKKDAVVGDFWNYNHFVQNEDNTFTAESYEMECIQIDTVITTKAGSFNCIKYYDKFKRWEDEDEKRFYYINPQIGLVKFSLIYNGEIEIEMSLKEYFIED